MVAAKGETIPWPSNAHTTVGIIDMENNGLRRSAPENASKSYTEKSQTVSTRHELSQGPTSSLGQPVSQEDQLDSRVHVSPVNKAIYNLVLRHLNQIPFRDEPVRASTTFRQDCNARPDDVKNIPEDSELCHYVSGLSRCVSAGKECSSSGGHPLVVAADEVIRDFGDFKCRLIVSKETTTNQRFSSFEGPHSQPPLRFMSAKHTPLPKQKTTIAIFFSVPNWNLIRREAMLVLRHVFGAETAGCSDVFSVSEPAARSSSGFVLPTRPPSQQQLRKEWLGGTESYNAMLRLSCVSLPPHFEKLQVAKQMAMLRIHAVGAPLRIALDRLGLPSGTDRSDNRDDDGEVGGECAFQTFFLRMQRPAKKSGQNGGCYVVPSQERVTVVFPVDYDDDTEMAFARLLLQQFSEAQRSLVNHISLACDYRRANDPQREVASQIQKHNLQHGSEVHEISGFLSFTMFPSQVNTACKKDRLVRQLVLFLSYLDFHIKSMKADMHLRMRQKKSALFAALSKPSLTTYSGWHQKQEPP